MSEAQVPAPAPSADAGGQAPAPAPAEAPTNQPDPSASQQQPTDQANDDQEWDSVTDELFPGIRTTQKMEDTGSEQTKSTQGGQAGGEAQGDNQNQTPDGQPGDDNAAGAGGEGSEGEGEEVGEGEGDGSEVPQADAAARDARTIAQQNAQYQQTFRDSVREQMFSKVPQTMQDADGDPISSVEDVMRLVNPETGQAFTREEAAQWLPQAQAQFERQTAAIEQRIAEIADVNIAVKDQADYINEKYGEVLKADPALRARLWQQYSKTLEVDKDSATITKAPVSLRDFYEVALQPYAQQNQATQQPQGQPQAQPQGQQSPQEDPNKKRQATRSDRSDIFGGSQTDTRDDDDKEWDQAATEVFGPLKP